MDPKAEFHPRDVQELASRRFFPEMKRDPLAGGKTAILLYAHADEFDRLNQIRKFLEKQFVAPHAQSFEIDLREFAPRRDGPGVPFGALVDRPVTFTIENAASSTWSCEIAVGDATTTCKLHGRGAELIGFEVAGQAKFADSFEQSDRNFVFHHVFALNKALEAYIQLSKF
jgi:hypothetical protein